MTALARTIAAGRQPAIRYRELRLLADDITGALDSAAAFAGLFGTLRVATARSAAPSLALDSGTREKDGAEAAATVARFADLLAPDHRRLSFFKLDSLLRGHAGLELAAVLQRLSFDRVILAPAMPDQGRFTQGGRQMALRGGIRVPAGEDLAATLKAAGLAVTLGRAGDAPGRGITFFDANDNADLDRIVAAGLACDGSVLWVGSAGLAGALAHALGPVPVSPRTLKAPLLGLIGTDHAVMRAQLAGVTAHHRSVADADATTIHSIAEMLDSRGVAFITCAIANGTDRQTAATQIAVRFAALASRLPAPATLFVSGGETLRALLPPALGAKGLDVLGEYEPGVALSALVQGRWKGTIVVSKSGAFGQPGFLSSLVSSCRTDSGSPLS